MSLPNEVCASSRDLCTRCVLPACACGPVFALRCACPQRADPCSQCLVVAGLTPRHYKELVALHNELHPRGLRILGFPCNQFGQQEPGTPQEIRAFADGFGVQFDLFAKCDVNGAKAHPVFQLCKSKLSDILGSSIKWNWTKFLLDRDGVPSKRFSPPVLEPLRGAIIELLDKTATPPQTTLEAPRESTERL